VKRYSFPLQSVRRLREHVEDAALGALAAARAAERQESERVEAAQRRYAEGVSDRSWNSADAFVADRLRAGWRAAAVKSAEERLRAARMGTDERETAYAAAVRERRVLDRLDDRLAEQHRAAALAEEEKERDDVVVSRFGRT
jgi:flagellar export protein FliJ